VTVGEVRGATVAEVPEVDGDAGEFLGVAVVTELGCDEDEGLGTAAEEAAGDGGNEGGGLETIGVEATGLEGGGRAGLLCPTDGAELGEVREVCGALTPPVDATTSRCPVTGEADVELSDERTLEGFSPDGNVGTAGAAVADREEEGSAAVEMGNRTVLVCCAFLCASTSFPTYTPKRKTRKEVSKRLRRRTQLSGRLKRKL